MTWKGIWKSRIWQLIIFCIAVSSLAAASAKTQTVFIQRSIDKIIATADPNVHVGVKIVSMRSGLVLYERNSRQLFIPSDCAKLFTAGAALSILGPDFSFETKLLTDGKLKDNVLEGNLYLQGSGDPSLSLSHLEELALQLRVKQIQKIEEDLVLDHYALDSSSSGPGWIADDLDNAFLQPLNGLCINHNCIQLWVAPANELAIAPKIFAFPKTDFVTIQNLALTDEKNNKIFIQKNPKMEGNVIQITGEIALDAPLQSYRIPLKQSHLFAGKLLESMLHKTGIKYTGKIKEEKVPLVSKQSKTSKDLLATHQSTPLVMLLQTMLKDNDNLYADQLFKKIGAIHAKEMGDWKNAGRAVRHHLEAKARLEIADLVLLDGSGFSRFSLVSPHHIVQYLSWIYREFSYGPEFLSALSLSGHKGQLQGRFANQKDLILRAHSASSNQVSSLGGFVQTKDKEELCFGIMINGFAGSSAKYKKEIEEKICLFLSNLTKK